MTDADRQRPHSAEKSPPVPTKAFPLVTYEGGNIRFHVPRPSYVPRHSAEEAYQIFKAAGLYTDAEAFSDPIVELVLYTDLTHGNMSQDGTITPIFVDEPAWVIAFTNYPFAGSGGAPGAPGVPPSPRPRPRPHNVISVISDQKGTGIVAMISVQHPQPILLSS